MNVSGFQMVMGWAGFNTGAGLLWWQLVCGTAHGVIAVAYIVVVVNLLRLHARCKENMIVPQTYIYVPLLLGFSVLMHIDDVATFYWPHRWFFAGLKLAAALVAVWGLPNFVGAASHQLRKVRKADDLATALGCEATPEESARRGLEERYELLRARVLFLEDLFRRNTWIHQSTLAMQHLNELLAEFETVLDARPAQHTTTTEDAA